MEWKTSGQLVDYEEAHDFMLQRVKSIKDDGADDLIWLLEHPPLYTSGSSAKSSDLLIRDKFPVYETGRGGQYTYHGPGQRIAYLMINLKAYASGKVPDIRVFVKSLEDWIIRSLQYYNIKAFTSSGRIGVWVNTKSVEKKIAALGIRVSGGIAYHGISVNISPELEHFSGIIPCGISDFGVTSLKELGKDSDMKKFDEILKSEFSFRC